MFAAAVCAPAALPFAKRLCPAVPKLDRRNADCQQRRRGLRVSAVAVGGDDISSDGLTGEAGPVKKASGARRGKMLVELSPWQNKQLDAFWERQGVRNVRHREKLLKLATALLLFRTPDELEERIASLKSSVFRVAGIAGLDVGTMVGRFPQVLCGDVAFCVETKLPQLAKILPGVDVQRLIEKVPQVLSLDVGVTVLARCTDLIKLLPNCDILSMIEAQPQLLTVSVQRCVAPNWAALQWRLAREGVSLAAAERVVQAMPRLLATTPGTIDARVTLLEDLVPGLLKAYENSPSALARLMCASEPVLHRMGYIRETHPDLLKTSRAGDTAAEEGAADAEPQGGGPLRGADEGSEAAAAGARGGDAAGLAAAGEGSDGKGAKGARGRSKALAPVTIVNRSEKAFREMFLGYAEWEERRLAALEEQERLKAAAAKLAAAPTSEPPLLISDLFPAFPRGGPSDIVFPPSSAGAERQADGIGVAATTSSSPGPGESHADRARRAAAGRAAKEARSVSPVTRQPDGRRRQRGEGDGGDTGGSGGATKAGGLPRSPAPRARGAAAGAADPADRQPARSRGSTATQQRRQQQQQQQDGAGRAVKREPPS